MTYPVTVALESFPKERATVQFSVVLRDFGPEAHCRYVTHCRNDDDGSHYWGHYFSDERLAREDFAKRAALYRRA